MACGLGFSLCAQEKPAYTLRAYSNLTLIDLLAVDRSSSLPDKTLRREDSELFDDNRAVPIANLDQGSGPGMRPVLLWLVAQCRMSSWTEEGSGFMAGNAGALREGLTHLEENEKIAVAHWCDNGEAAVDLLPSLDHETALPVMDALLRPVYSRPGNTRAGELALQAMIRKTQEASRQAARKSIPVLVFLHGDKMGAPPEEIDTLLDEALENDSMLFVLNDGAMRSWQPVLPGMERSHVLAYLAEQTGGAAMAVDVRDPEGYSQALAAILDRLHGRYQIGFVPRRLTARCTCCGYSSRRRRNGRTRGCVWRFAESIGRRSRRIYARSGLINQQARGGPRMRPAAEAGLKQIVKPENYL